MSIPQLPLLIGVTGHRDLLAEEIPRLREAVRAWLLQIQAHVHSIPVQVVTSLSSGADLLVAEEAAAMGMECLAVLPFPADQYRADFIDPQDLRRFDIALARCRRCLVCPPVRSQLSAQSDPPDDHRTLQYAAAGEVIATASFMLLALWDGYSSLHRAGTARTVEFRLAQRAWCDDGNRVAHQELIPNLPRDLIYHIVVSRIGSGPAPGLKPLQQGYRSAPDGAFESKLPDHVELIIERTGELNRSLCAPDSVKGLHVDLIADLAQPPPEIVETAELFSATDHLASRLSSAVLSILLTTAVLTVFMGSAFVIYSHSDPNTHWRYAIFAFLGCFLLLIVVNLSARRRQLHRRHLEVRALAEALRVELFWAIAGVASDSGIPAAHRRILKQSDPALEWIPNALRAVALILFPSRQAGLVGGIDFALRKWIGVHGQPGPSSQQLNYFWRTGREKSAHVAWAERLALATLVIGLVVTLILAAESVVDTGWYRTSLIFLMGLLPLLAGVIETTLHSTADRELRRQYEFMYEVFRSARERLLKARSDTERRAVLSLLGNAALAEHAEWLFLHRDRPIDRSRLQ